MNQDKSRLLDSSFILPPFGSRVGLSQSVDDRLVARPDCLANRSARGFAGDLQANGQALARQAARHAVGPLDQADAVAVEILMGAEVEELALASQPIGVEVVDRQPGLVFLDEDKRRAAYGA